MTIDDSQISPRVGNTYAFAFIFFPVTLSRALLISVIPLEALELLGTAQWVSVFYFGVSFLGILASISVPSLARHIGGRGVMITGAVSMLFCAPLLATPGLPLFVTGMLLYVFGYAAMEVALTVFILRFIPRRQLTYFEPKRVLFMALGYIVGPWLGTTLEKHVAHELPFAITAVVAVSIVVYMGYLGLTRRLTGEPTPASAGVLRNVRRFTAQPRLRLAWVLTFARASWWTMFIIYTPIYAVTTGLGEVAGGALVSIGVVFVLSVPFWGRVGRRYGLRRMFFWSFLCVGVITPLVAVFADNAWVGAVMLLLAALCVTPLDGAGNITFLRAVRSHEQAEMSGVFITYRDAAQLIPPGVFAVLLGVYALPVVFVAGGVGMLSMTFLCRYLPRRL